MKRVNLYTHPENYPPHGMVYMVTINGFAEITADMVGTQIPDGHIVVAPTRHYTRRRRNVGRWIASNYQRITAKWKGVKQCPHA